MRKFIRSIDSLRAHLQTAIELEHSTIPPYLCALYSMKDGHNREAASITRSVVMEEMLHMVLAANVLNAIGGSPSIDHPRFVPRYPGFLPHSSKRFTVGLTRFSRSAVNTFIRIERPAPGNGRAEADEYDTIGQFYAAIEDGLKSLCRNDRGFARGSRRQITPDQYYGAGGQLVVVTDLDSALRALNEIVHQGEGFNHEVLDGDTLVCGAAGYAHYFRFKEIALGRRYTATDTIDSGPTGHAFPVDWQAVYKMRANPRSGDLQRGSDVWRKSTDFNRAYSRLLQKLHAACSGKPSALGEAVSLMFDLKYLAIELMRIPIGDGRETAGPSFEYVK